MKAERQNKLARSLDPTDWDDYRLKAHALLDVCIDHLQYARDRPAWRSPASAVQISEDFPPQFETELGEVIADFERMILPYPTGNTHPRFFGWVHGSGTANGLLAEMCAATMNSNCGGRDHIASYVERTVINWARQLIGLPSNASGVLTTGTSEATLIAFYCAMVHRTNGQNRSKGLPEFTKFSAYASQEAHSAIGKSLEVMGIGKTSLRLIPVDANFAMDTTLLQVEIDKDRAAGYVPICVVGTAGSVNCGAFDDLEQISILCKSNDIWFHVDGAFGVWAAIADEPWRSKIRGAHLADSIAFDFHKWMYVPYDCGCVLIRSHQIHRAAFAARPDYLGGALRGTAGGEPWFCDYGIALSRGFRALKVWFAFKQFGVILLGQNISENCRQALFMAKLVEDSTTLELMAPVNLNICCFRYTNLETHLTQQDSINEEIAMTLQEEGSAVVSTTKIDGKVVLRAAMVNHRTTMDDVRFTIRAVHIAGSRLSKSHDHTDRLL